MHSTIATVFFAAAASLTNAAVLKRGNAYSQTECQGKGAYYVCSNNAFRGYCTVDPCAKTWCPDFQAGTCLPPSPVYHVPSNATVTVTHTVTSTTTTCTESGTPTPLPPACGPVKGAYYVCANNGFRGYCSSDPCAKAWCPDYKLNSYKCEVKDPEKPTDCHHCSAPVVTSTSTSSYSTHTTTPTPCSTITPSTTTPCTTPTPDILTKPVVTDSCANGLGYYQVCSNGFRGCCKQDACAGSKPVCPGEEPKTTLYAA